jgi:hypothetical protein
MCLDQLVNLVDSTSCRFFEGIAAASQAARTKTFVCLHFRTYRRASNLSITSTSCPILIVNYGHTLLQLDVENLVGFLCCTRSGVDTARCPSCRDHIMVLEQHSLLGDDDDVLLKYTASGRGSHTSFLWVGFLVFGLGARAVPSECRCPMLGLQPRRFNVPK